MATTPKNAGIIIPMPDSEILKKFRQESTDQIKNLRSSDIIPDDGQPVKKFLTLVFRPPENILKTCEDIIEQLRSIDSNQYYYPRGQMHATLVGEIESEDPELVVESVKKIVPKYNLLFKVWGQNSSKFIASVSCYPVGFSVHGLRDEIRKYLNISGTDYKIHLSTYEYVCWINYLRYTAKPKEKLIDKIREGIDREFGEFKPESIDLYETTSKVLRPEESRLLYSFRGSF